MAKKILLEDIQADGWDLLESLSMWCSAEYCAKKLNISADTLDRRLQEKFGYGFKEYRKDAQEPMRINLLKKQYEVAMQGNVSMLIWLGKNHLGQSDKVEESKISEIKVIIDDQDKDL